MRRTRVHLLDGKAYVRCVVEILIFIVHWYVTSKALVSDILSLAVPNLEGKVQGPVDRKKYIRISGKISIVERISNLFASYETSQWVQSRLVKILYLYDWICLLESGLFDLLFVSTAEIALPQIKFRAAKARITICKLFVVHVPARMCCTCIVLSLLLFQLPSCF